MAYGIYETLKYLQKQIRNICCKLKLIEELEGIPGPQGPPGQDGAPGAPGGFGAYGSYYSTVDQVNTIGGNLPMTVNNTDFQNGISIVSGSRITFAAAGKYNIQFSAQFHHIGGGGSGKHVDIWFAKNGITIPLSNTKLSCDTNTPYKVAAWNYFVDAAAGDYYEIRWTTENASIIIEYETASSPHPAIPSVIITVNQVG